MNTRPPPPQGTSYPFVTRVYRRDLRSLVMLTAFLGAFWSLISGIGYFRNWGVDKSQHVPRIASLSLVLGIVYMVVLGIELFGLYSAVSRRAPLVRMYALLSGLSALVVIGSGLARVVTHFVWKNDILNECTTLTSGDSLVWFAFWGPIYHENVTPAEAAAWCRDSWDHDSWALIVGFLILSVLAIFFSLIAFGYWRQLLDPTSPANTGRAPSAQVRASGYPSHYAPAYNTTYAGYESAVPNLPYKPYAANGGYGFSEHDDTFVPPYDADSKPPGYVGAGTAGDFKGVDGEERDVTSRPGPGGRETFH